MVTRGRILQQMEAMAIKCQTRQIINRNSNEMGKGPFGKWQFCKNGVFGGNGD